MLEQAAKHRYRSVFVSDIHLGLRECRADLLADFLRRVTCDHLYLVGDVIDGWQLRKSWYWDRHHEEAVRLVLEMARDGVAVTYIPGNHDEVLRGWLGLEITGMRLVRRAEHRTADGRRILVVHGDEFDGVMRCARFVAWLGDRGYDASLRLNRWCNAVRSRFGYPYWSLAQWLKCQVTQAMTAVARFEHALVHEAGRLGFDGVICGHVHCPKLQQFDRVSYMNDGDWVESCTALVEHFDGRFELLNWAEQPARERRASAWRQPALAAGSRISA